MNYFIKRRGLGRTAVVALALCHVTGVMADMGKITGLGLNPMEPKRLGVGKRMELTKRLWRAGYTPEIRYTVTLAAGSFHAATPIPEEVPHVPEEKEGEDEEQRKERLAAEAEVKRINNLIYFREMIQTIVGRDNMAYNSKGDLTGNDAYELNELLWQFRALSVITAEYSGDWTATENQECCHVEIHNVCCDAITCADKRRKREIGQIIANHNTLAEYVDEDKYTKCCCDSECCCKKAACQETWWGFLTCGMNVGSAFRLWTSTLATVSLAVGTAFAGKLWEVASKAHEDTIIDSSRFGLEHGNRKGLSALFQNDWFAKDVVNAYQNITGDNRQYNAITFQIKTDDLIYDLDHYTTKIKEELGVDVVEVDQSWTTGNTVFAVDVNNIKTTTLERLGLNDQFTSNLERHDYEQVFEQVLWNEEIANFNPDVIPINSATFGFFHDTIQMKKPDEMSDSAIATLEALEPNLDELAELGVSVSPGNGILVGILDTNEKQVRKLLGTELEKLVDDSLDVRKKLGKSVRVVKVDDKQFLVEEVGSGHFLQRTSMGNVKELLGVDLIEQKALFQDPLDVKIAVDPSIGDCLREIDLQGTRIFFGVMLTLLIVCFLTAFCTLSKIFSHDRIQQENWRGEGVSPFQQSLYNCACDQEDRYV